MLMKGKERFKEKDVFEERWRKYQRKERRKQGVKLQGMLRRTGGKEGEERKWGIEERRETKKEFGKRTDERRRKER